LNEIEIKEVKEGYDLLEDPIWEYLLCAFWVVENHQIICAFEFNLPNFLRAISLFILSVKVL